PGGFPPGFSSLGSWLDQKSRRARNTPPKVSVLLPLVASLTLLQLATERPAQSVLNRSHTPSTPRSSFVTRDQIKLAEIWLTVPSGKLEIKPFGALVDTASCASRGFWAAA